jgi:hypothetical protein
MRVGDKGCQLLFQESRSLEELPSFKQKNRKTPAVSSCPTLET